MRNTGEQFHVSQAEICEIAYSLGILMGSLAKHYQEFPSECSDIYQKLLAFMPGVEWQLWWKNFAGEESADATLVNGRALLSAIKDLQAVTTQLRADLTAPRHED